MLIGSGIGGLDTVERQVKILDKRGVLSPDEVHRLASKTAKAMDAEDKPADRKLALKVFEQTTVRGKVGERLVETHELQTDAEDGAAAPPSARSFCGPGRRGPVGAERGALSH